LVKGCTYTKYVFPLSPHCYPPDCISFLLCQNHTPLTVKIEGVARDHRIELKKEGCQPVVKTIRNT
jgi:hypothetical protein